MREAAAVGARQVLGIPLAEEAFASAVRPAVLRRLHRAHAGRFDRPCLAPVRFRLRRRRRRRPVGEA